MICAATVPVSTFMCLWAIHTLDFRCSVCMHGSVNYVKFWKPEVWVHDSKTRDSLNTCPSMCLEYLYTIGGTSQCLCFSYSHGFFHFKWWLLTSCFSAYTARFYSKTSTIYLALGKNHVAVPAGIKFSKSATLGFFWGQIVTKTMDPQKDAFLS